MSAILELLSFATYDSRVSLSSSLIRACIKSRLRLDTFHINYPACIPLQRASAELSESSALHRVLNPNLAIIRRPLITRPLGWSRWNVELVLIKLRFECNLLLTASRCSQFEFRWWSAQRRRLALLFITITVCGNKLQPTMSNKNSSNSETLHGRY